MQQLNFISSFLLAPPFLDWGTGLRLWLMGGNHFTPEPRPSWLCASAFFSFEGKVNKASDCLSSFVFLKILIIWVFGIKAISTYN